MVQSDDAVQKLEALGRAQGPAFGEHQVVDVLKIDARDFPEDVERLQQLLEVDQGDFPGAILPFDDRFERGGRGAMAPAGVEIEELDTFHNFVHKCFIAESHRCHTAGLKV